MKRFDEGLIAAKSFIDCEMGDLIALKRGIAIQPIAIR